MHRTATQRLGMTSMALALLALLCAALLAACASPASQPGAGAGANAGTGQAPGEPGIVPPWDKPARPGKPLIGAAPDRRCTRDTDCTVKNVGNCCGYYPACVNKDAMVDPKAVQEACARSGMAGVCGFKEITACSCQQNQCADVSTSPLGDAR